MPSTASSLAFIALLLGADAATSDPVFGAWRTPEGDAIIEIGACGDEACGRIAHLAVPLDAAGRPPVDMKNPDPSLRDRPICGLPLLSGFRRDAEGEWSGGAIYDSRSGETYDALIALRADGKLEVRGYVGLPMFGETQVWTRVSGDFQRC